MSPKKITVKEKKYLHIIWDNGQESDIPLRILRENCPCANCLMERQNRAASYIPLLSGAAITIKDIKVIGSYAIQIYWQDGHDLGIYTFEFLKEVSDNIKP